MAGFSTSPPACCVRNTSKTVTRPEQETSRNKCRQRSDAISASNPHHQLLASLRLSKIEQHHGDVAWGRVDADLRHAFSVKIRIHRAERIRARSWRPNPSLFPVRIVIEPRFFVTISDSQDAHGAAPSADEFMDLRNERKMCRQSVVCAVVERFQMAACWIDS